MSKPIIPLLLLAASCAAHAEESTIVPDRPGFSTGTYTMAPGRINLEFGYQYSFNNSGEDNATHTVPQLTFRTGVTSNLEFDILWDGWNIDDADDQSSKTSVSDLSIGGKYRLVEHEQFNITALGLISLPTGDDPSTSDQVDPTLGLLWDYSVSDDIALFGTLQAASTAEDGKREYSGQFAVGTSYTITAQTGVFVEYFNDVPFDSDFDDQHTLDAGLTYLLSNDVQLDIHGGVALNDAADNFIGTGVAVRF